MNELDELLKRFALTESGIQKIQKEIIDFFAANIKPHSSPQVIILGAGKTELEKVALRELHHDAVINNADNYRDYHPQVAIIKKYYEPWYPKLTAPYAQRWALGLHAYYRELKLSYTLETTLRDGKKNKRNHPAFKIRWLPR